MKLYVVQLVAAQLLILLSTVHSQSQGCTGSCVNIRDCPQQLSLLRQIQSGTAPSGSLQQLRSGICSFQNNVPFVCCPSSRTPTQPPTPTVIGTPSPPTSPLLPSECGKRALVDRVISGEDAPLLAWPWIVLLEAQGNNGRSSIICGGVLISDRYVMTAAHCVDPRTAPALRNVRIGEHTINTNPDCREGTCAEPVQIIRLEGPPIIHENYGQPFGCRNCNDIALLRLARRVQFTNLFVSPVCLPQNLERDLGFSQKEFNKKPVWVAGWGTTDPLEPRQANVLQQVSLPLDRSLCSNDLRVFPDQNMVLCAGGRQQDTCRGDSGGPMVVGNKGETKYFVVGIVSRGPRVCAAANTGGLYTNVTHYVPWIISKLRP